MNHNDQHDIIIISVQYWHTCLSDNQYLSNWSYDPSNKKEIMPSIGSPTTVANEVMDLGEATTTTLLN